MALTPGYWLFSYTFQDRNGHKTVRSYRCTVSPTTDSIASLRGLFTSLAANLASFSASKIIESRLSCVYQETSLVLPTSAEAENASLLTVTALSREKPNERVMLTIPAPSHDFFTQASGRGNDLVFPTGSNLLYYFLAPFDTTKTNYLRASDGDSLITETGKGVRSHRKSSARRT